MYSSGPLLTGLLLLLGWLPLHGFSSRDPFFAWSSDYVFGLFNGARLMYSSGLMLMGLLFLECIQSMGKVQGYGPRVKSTVHCTTGMLR